MDLFAGGGGFSYALEETGGFETVAFCENDPAPRALLKQKWPDVPLYDDVRTLDYDGPIDIICGGFPCQPFSQAGQRRGKEDDRHLWPAMFELIKTYRPTWVIGENVIGLINMGLDTVLSDLESEGYACQTFIVPACGIDALHRRNRIFIVGYTEHHGHPASKKRGGVGQNAQGSAEGPVPTEQSAGAGEPRSNGKLGRNVPDTASIGDPRAPCEGSGASGRPSQLSPDQSGIDSEIRPVAYSKGGQGHGDDDDGRHGKAFMEGLLGEYGSAQSPDSGGEPPRWPLEPCVGRVVDGISPELYKTEYAPRLKILGNAIVPQIMMIFGFYILQVMEEYNIGPKRTD